MTIHVSNACRAPSADLVSHNPRFTFAIARPVSLQRQRQLQRQLEEQEAAIAETAAAAVAAAVTPDGKVRIKKAKSEDMSKLFRRISRADSETLFNGPYAPVVDGGGCRPL